MIQNKALTGKSLDELRCHWKMLCMDKDVVGKIELFQPGDAALEFWLKQESIRFALNNVANSH